MSEDTNNTDEIEIKALLEAWADAVRRHDLPAILARHEPDMVMFDLPPPLQCKGIDAYKETWGLLFRYHRPGTVFDIQELAVTAGKDVAFDLGQVATWQHCFGFDYALIAAMSGCMPMMFMTRVRL
ncbi:MAG TPA: nuclear transport factor 2 family protein [Bryobacteraceae bacterium]|jgi:ketosteroid isomerase-like protein|nr:nuclear transport factor 2 family protein [Bryobacteraceae bacterium]